MYEIGEDESISDAVVKAVASVTGRNALPKGELDELDPLYDAVDTDSLELIFRGRDDGKVSFFWSDCQVEVHDHKYVVVTNLS